MTTTGNLGLKKPSGSDKVLVKDLNDNADVLDEAIGSLSELETTEKGSLVKAINEANKQGAAYASQAAASATAAETAKTGAQTAQSGAEKSATAAASSASAAAGSATAAGNSATAAADSATSAAGSESAAADSATSAGSSATAAATSKNEAEAARDGAQAAQSAAEAARDEAQSIAGGQYVRYDTQTLTSTQQQQARENIGLGNVDNTSDADKPVSTAQQEALDAKANTADVNTALDGKVSHNAAQALTVAQKEQAQSNIGVTYPCNPNLLDNWYFGNPVNQRGQTEYATPTDGTKTFSIDRWHSSVQLAAATVTIADGGLSIAAEAGRKYSPLFNQKIENYRELLGKTVTASILIDEIENDECYIRINNGIHASQVMHTAGLHSATWTIDSTLSYIDLVLGSSVVNSAPTYKIRAMKLELGTQQTLAHQDADGNWILNEIPNYAEQLARCQRYYVQYGDANATTPLGMCNPISSTTGSVHVPLPVPMRATPTATLTGSITTRRSGGSTVTHSSASVAGVSPSEVMLTVSSGSMSTQYYPYDAYLAAGSYLALSADL